MWKRRQLRTQVPGSVTVGDVVKYDGWHAEVVETDLPGEYGPRVAIRMPDGSEVVTTPELDRYWNRDVGNPLPSLTDLLHAPPESQESRGRRQVRHRATAPHARCAGTEECLEHAQDRRVQSCKDGPR